MSVEELLKLLKDNGIENEEAKKLLEKALGTFEEEYEEDKKRDEEEKFSEDDKKRAEEEKRLAGKLLGVEL